MQVIISEKAESELAEMDKTMAGFFIRHIEKISQMPPRRHLRFGLPFFVEDVTKQARLIYYFENDSLFVLRCFATHKGYEKWYHSFI